MDLGLVRLILQEVDAELFGEMIQIFRFEGFDPISISEHLELLIEAGCLEGELVGRNWDCTYAFPKLTPRGQNLLDHARNDLVWQSVVADLLQSPEASISMEAVELRLSRKETEIQTR